MQRAAWGVCRATNTPCAIWQRSPPTLSLSSSARLNTSANNGSHPRRGGRWQPPRAAHSSSAPAICSTCSWMRAARRGSFDTVWLLMPLAVGAQSREICSWLVRSSCGLDPLGEAPLPGWLAHACASVLRVGIPKRAIRNPVNNLPNGHPLQLAHRAHARSHHHPGTGAHAHWASGRPSSGPSGATSHAGALLRSGTAGGRRDYEQHKHMEWRPHKAGLGLRLAEAARRVATSGTVSAAAGKTWA